MSALLVVLFALALALSGCANISDEKTPIEKRNDFDVCVIRWMEGAAVTEPNQQRAREACVYLLE